MQSRFESAREHVAQALAAHRGCTRATLLSGDVAAAQGDDEAAIAQWQRIEAQDPAFLALAAERFAQAYRRLGRAGQGLRLLEGYQGQYPSVDLFNALYQLTLEERGPEAALDLVRSELSRHPTLLGLDKLLEVELLRASAERRRDLELVKGLVAQHTRRLGTYRCDHCGFRAKQYYWRCPGCARWETCPPRRSEGPEGHAA
jgi:lipopolysaccharide biosynthesis regulator YciM